jgi:predicted DNA-binding transcriptional regulator AlpA
MTTETKHRRADVPAVSDAAVLSSADLAALLRTTPKQIANMRARGQLPPPAKVAGLGLRWTRAAVDAWLAEQMAA